MIYKWVVGVLFLVASLINSSNILAATSQNERVSPLQVVTTFSVLADLVAQVGGKHVDVHTLVDWDEDAHVYHPTPADVRRLAKAKLLVMNGLGFEGWLERLTASSKFSGDVVVATTGIEVIKLGDSTKSHQHKHDQQPAHNKHSSHELEESDDNHGKHEDHGHEQTGVDPHAWHSLKAVKVYVQNILKALIKLDAHHQSYYQANAAQYLLELDKLIFQTNKKLTKLNSLQRNIVMPHNAFAYLARDYDLHVFSLKGVNSESEASAAQIARVIRKIKTENIRAVFSETTADDRLIKLVQQETNAVMGGALISGALAKKIAPTYLDMMRYNINQITHALGERKD